MFSQRMLNVCAVVKSRKIADQSEPPYRTPADIFDLAVVYLGLGRDHHRPAGKLAVVKCQEEAATAVKFCFPFDTHGERATVEACKREKDRYDISQLTPCAEPSGAQGCHICG